MKDPAPNPVAILTDFLVLHRTQLASSPGLHSLIRIIHPTIFYDDGSGTFSYDATGTGADYTANYVTGAAFTRLNGMQLQTKTTTPAANDLVSAYKYLPLGPGPIVRLQLLFRRASGTSTNFTSAFRMLPDNETNLLTAEVEAHWQSGKLAYHKKTNGAWAMTELADSFLQPDNNQWHKLDVAVNIHTHKWVHIILNGKTLALPALELETAASANHGRILNFILGTLALEAVQAETHLDQILITTEEA